MRASRNLNPLAVDRQKEAAPLPARDLAGEAGGEGGGEFGVDAVEAAVGEDGDYVAGGELWGDGADDGVGVGV